MHTHNCLRLISVSSCLTRTRKNLGMPFSAPRPPSKPGRPQKALKESKFFNESQGKTVPHYPANLLNRSISSKVLKTFSESLMAFQFSDSKGRNTYPCFSNISLNKARLLVSFSSTVYNEVAKSGSRGERQINLELFLRAR